MKRSELDEILQQHKLWLESRQKQGARAYLRGVNLQGVNLQGAYFQCADLQGVDLRGANLQGANLRGVNLWNANLGGTNLRGANLQDADLRGASLSGATFDLNFKKVWHFHRATFSEDQAPWVVLHPKYPKWAGTLKWAKDSAEAA